ncbi:MAG: hypothetical protein HRU03_02355 [Nanoarchaeales archaeon]|nr:hypothetical protein [Nanoarchaeales archaeon]
MDKVKETQQMKEDAKKLFKDKDDRKEFCDFCDKKIKECEHNGNHPKKK